MSSTHNYYQRFIAKLNKKLNENKENIIQNCLPDGLSIAPKELSNFYQNIPSNPSNDCKKKRDIKFRSKAIKDNFESFIHSVNTNRDNTLIDYTQVVADFVSYSPESKIEDYFEYLKFKSGCSPDVSKENFIVQGTIIKYANIIRRYLVHLHHKDVPNLNVEYFKKPKSRPKDSTLKISRRQVFEFYQTLNSHFKIEDALILHTMYSLGLEPYNLCLLKFDLIKDDKSIMYYDHRERGYKSLKLTDILYQELMYFKKYKELKSQFDDREERQSVDGTLIYGPFIFSIKATGIFNKFERKFGGLLKNFNITPRDLVKLSKSMRKTSQMNLY